MKTFKAVLWLLVGLKGTPAPRVRVGRVKPDQLNRLIFKTYRFNVDFEDTAGGAHHAQKEFTTLFTSVDQEEEPEVRYDPSDPSRFVLSWARHVTGARVAAAVFFVVMGPVFLVGAYQQLRGTGRRTRPVTPGAAS